MALKSTIYKFNLALSDIDRNHYADLNLTVARHPSETVERLMARLLAYCLNADEQLEFSKGLSDTDEPDLWRRALDGQILTWIDVGEPGANRVKKAARQAQAVKIYSFNRKSSTWWRQFADDVHADNVSVFRFSWDAICSLARLAERTMQASVTITGSSAYVATKAGECEVTWDLLQTPET